MSVKLRSKKKNRRKDDEKKRAEVRERKAQNEVSHQKQSTGYQSLQIEATQMRPGNEKGGKRWRVRVRV